MKKREAVFIAAMAALGGEGCRDNPHREPAEGARVSATGPEQPSGEAKERRPRKFNDVLGKDLRWHKEGLGITEKFDFGGETDRLLEEAREEVWEGRFGSNEAGMEKYFSTVIDNLEYRQRVWRSVDKYCRLYRVPWEVAAGVIGVESGGDNSAVSSAGARGIFQVMEGVKKELARLGFNKEKDWATVDLTSVDGNCRAGVAYLRFLFDRYSQWGVALAAYNGGPAAVDASIKDLLTDKDRQKIEKGKFREFLFKNSVNATFVCSSRNSRSLGNDAKWRYPFKAAVIARPVYDILTSRDKRPRMRFGKDD